MKSTIITAIKKAPRTPGVYLFYEKKQLLYVGKAADLRARLKNYLTPTDYKTEALDKEATHIKLLMLRSNVEALITEAKLIKELKPRYNILWRDDKNYLYVAVTDEKFPRIFITHQPQLAYGRWLMANGSKEKSKNYKQIIGPFTDGRPLKAVLRLLRRHFPYCTCSPHYRICLNAQIGNCFGFCCNKNTEPTQAEIRTYQKNIRSIASILTGKDKRFLKTLKDPYELLILDAIWSHQPYLANSNKSHMLEAVRRVECYDNSHLSGKEAVGAMTVLIKQEDGSWKPDVNEWRKFKIIGNYTQDDPRMMMEVVSRRLRHPEWRYPDLMIIDGGITQYRAAKKAIQILVAEHYPLKTIQVISFAKPQQEIYGFKAKPVSLKTLPEQWQRLIQRAIHQTHNFVIRYHRRIRARVFLKSE